MVSLHSSLMKWTSNFLGSTSSDLSALMKITELFHGIISTDIDCDVYSALNANRSSINSVCEKLYEVSRVPVLKNGVKEHSDEEFISHKSNITHAIDFFSCLSSLLIGSSKKHVDTDKDDVLTSECQIRDIRNLFERNTVVFGLLLACENIDGSKGWTNDSIVLSSQKLINKIAGINTADISHLLTQCPAGDDLIKYSYFSQIMNQIIKQTKLSGVNCIGTLTAFIYLVQRVEHPNLSEYLDKVFPTCLLLVDDYDVDNKVNGIVCLRHIIRNVSYSSMQLYGRSSVIYSTLHKLLYTNEAKLLQVVLPTMLAILRVEYNMPGWMITLPASSINCTKFHDVMNMILCNMEMENKLNMRRVYMSQLPEFVSVLGIQCAQHFHRLFRVIYGYMEEHDGTNEVNRVLALKTLYLVITNTWPRIPRYSKDILKNIMKLIVEIADDNALIEADALGKVLEQCSICLKALHVLDSHNVEETVKVISEIEIPGKAKVFLLKQVELFEETTST